MQKIRLLRVAGCANAVDDVSQGKMIVGKDLMVVRDGDGRACPLYP